MSVLTPERWKQVKELLEAALAHEPGRRKAFLAEACAGDSSLQREVETLISSHEQAGSLLEVPAIQIPIESAAEDEADSMIGQQIGPYAILREIGRGGMGAVYLADRADGQYQKKVAIKLIKRGMDTDAILRRFRKERQISATLEHSNIARLFDGGTTEDGLPYFVMEYIEGRPINEYCDAQKLSTTERLKLFCTVCSAVDCAHENLVVHRDLKPSNILVTEEGMPKLLDFGIAKVLSPEPSLGTVEATATDLRPMTPEYASPEQVRGGPITMASDIYSLGVLLYELLSGHRPYRFKTHEPQEVLRIICEEEPEKPSTATSRVEEVPSPDGKSQMTLSPDSVSRARSDQPEKLRRRLVGDLDHIVLKAMRKEPHRRYASPQQLSEDIRRHLAGLPVTARKGTFRYRGGKLIKRHKVGFLSAAIVVAGLLAGVLVDRWQTQGARIRPGTIRRLAVLPLQNLSRDPEQDYFADGMTEALISDLSKVSALRVISRTSVMQYKGVKKPLPQIARELNVDAVVEGSVLRSGDRVRITAQLVHAPSDRHLWAEQYDRDLSDILALQSEVARAITSQVKVRLTPEEQARLTRAGRVDAAVYQLYLQGRHYLNIYDPKTALERFNQALALDPSNAASWAGVALSYYHMSNTHLPPAEAIPKARAAAKKALALDDTLAEAYTSLGLVKSIYDWDWAGAEQDYSRAIQLNPGSSAARHYYGMYLIEVGRADRAAAELRRAVELDPLSPSTEVTALWPLYYGPPSMQNYDKLIGELLKIAELQPRFRPTYVLLGQAYEQKGMYGEAIAAFQQVRRLAGGPAPSILARIGRAYALAGKRREAQQVLAELRELSKQLYVSPVQVARVHAGLGEKDKAFAALENAFKQRDEELVFLKVDPRLDSLRSDPRFADLLRRVGFPP